MRNSRLLTRLVTGLVALTLGTAGALVFGAGPAQAAEVIAIGPSNVKVTISNDHFHPGERILLSGTGFVEDPGSGSGGNPVLALRVNDNEDDFPAGWEAGGDIAETVYGADDREGFIPFEIENGSFSGWIDLPDSPSPLPTASWLRFLGGSLTTVQDGVKLPAMSFKGDIRLIPDTTETAWITSNNHVPSGAIGVELRNFKRQDGQGGQKVAFRIDAQGPVLHCAETDAEGDGSAVVPIPAELTGKDHTLNVLAGTSCGEGTQAPPRSVPLAFSLTEATITSTTHTPGGKLTVKLSNFKNASGVGGQSVAFRIDAAGPVLTCIATNGNGDATGDVPIPAEITAGAHTLNVLAGTACGAGSQPPPRSIPLAFDVTDAADPTVARATGGSVNAKGTKVTLALKPGTAETTKLTVKSKGKVKLPGAKKKKLITVAKGSVGAQTKVTLSLTKTGKKYFKKNKSLKVVVTSKAPGAAAATKTFKVKKK